MWLWAAILRSPSYVLRQKWYFAPFPLTHI